MKITGVTLTTIQDESGRIIYDASDYIDDHKEAMEITSLFAGAKETSAERDRLKEENERLNQAYKYIHASRNSVDNELNELQAINSELLEALTSLVNEINSDHPHLSNYKKDLIVLAKSAIAKAMKP